MRTPTLAVWAALIAATAFAREARFANAPYMDPKLSAEERCRDLVSRMTLVEKVAALSTTAGYVMYEIDGDEVRPTRRQQTPSKKVRLSTPRVLNHG